METPNTPPVHVLPAAEPGLLEKRLREKAEEALTRRIEGVMNELRGAFGTNHVHKASITLTDGVRYDPEKKTATVSLHNAIAAIKAEFLRLFLKSAGDEAVLGFVQRFNELDRDVARMMNDRDQY